MTRARDIAGLDGTTLFDADNLKGYNATGRHANYTGDLDDIDTNSVYNIDNSVVTNGPSMATSWGFIHTMVHVNDDTYRTQIVYGMDSTASKQVFMRTRNGSTWESWAIIADGDNTLTTSHFAGLQDTGAPSTYSDDCDDIDSTSLYVLDGDIATNAPFSAWGYIQTHYASATYAQQIVYAMTSTHAHQLWSRVKNAGTWGSWAMIADGDVTNTLKSDTSLNLSVGYTTDVEILGGNQITPNLTTEWLKSRTVTGNVTINEVVDGNEGGCVILLTADGSGPYTVTLGTGVSAVGIIPDLAASTSYECRVIKHSASLTTVAITEIV